MAKGKAGKAGSIPRSTNGRVVKTSTRHGRVTVAQARKAVAAVAARKRG